VNDCSYSSSPSPLGSPQHPLSQRQTRSYNIKEASTARGTNHQSKLIDRHAASCNDIKNISKCINSDSSTESYLCALSPLSTCLNIPAKLDPCFLHVAIKQDNFHVLGITMDRCEWLQSFMPTMFLTNKKLSYTNHTSNYVCRCIQCPSLGRQ